MVVKPRFSSVPTALFLEVFELVIEDVALINHELCHERSILFFYSPVWADHCPVNRLGVVLISEVDLAF